MNCRSLACQLKNVTIKVYYTWKVMVWNRVKAHPILRSNSILASTERDSFQSGRPRAPNALRMADSVMEEKLALYTACTNPNMASCEKEKFCTWVEGIL